MTQKFSAQVHQIIQKNTSLMTMVAQDATQSLINEAQKPKGKGGKMPIKTGFLRASGRLSLNSAPTGPVRGDPKETYSSPDEVSITGFKLGMTIYFGWTAIYARKQDLYNGYFSDNITRWQEFVDNAVRKLRDKLK